MTTYRVRRAFNVFKPDDTVDIDPDSDSAAALLRAGYIELPAGEQKPTQRPSRPRRRRT